MVIAFFPGAGGNRYLQMLLGKDWKQQGISYDAKNQEQVFENRYLLNDVVNCNTEHILTHCMNSLRLRSVFPNRKIVFLKSDLKLSIKREWMLHGHERYIKKQSTVSYPRLEHYRAYKSQNWPDIESEEQLYQLPTSILDEVNKDYNKLQLGDISVPAILTHLTTQCIDEINSAYDIINWHQQYYRDYKVDSSCADQIVDIDNSDTEFAKLMRIELKLYQSTIFDRVWNKINEQR